MNVRLLFILSFISLNLRAQVNNPMHSIYLEILGPGGWASLNYEHRIYNCKNFHLNLRSGVSTYRLKDYDWKWNPDIIIPVGMSANYGNAHKIEAGIGTIFSSIIVFDEVKNKTRSFETNFYASLGYKYQSKKGLLLRIAYTPLLLNMNRFKNWVGASVGYSF